VAYLANKRDRPKNWNTLLALQNRAQMQMLGIWSEFVGREVVITWFGAAYHLRTCRHLVRSTNYQVLPASQAMEQGSILVGNSRGEVMNVKVRIVCVFSLN
jgi:hypothetical protein